MSQYNTLECVLAVRLEELVFKDKIQSILNFSVLF